VKEIDDTPPTETESEYDHAEVVRWITDIWTELKIHEKNDGHLHDRIKVACEHIKALEAEVADLHHRRRVSRQQATDQDPEWH